MSYAIAKFMICTKPWKVELEGTSLDVKEGDIVTVERTDFATDVAVVHFGGMLRKHVDIGTLTRYTRVAEPDEFLKTLKHCARCDRIEIAPGNWKPKPPCFTPRAGVTIIDETCPECDR
jgi:hypothetical protein